MNHKVLKRKPNLLRSVIAGMGLVAASGFTFAQTTASSVDLDLSMQCTFPLIGATPIHVTGSAALPATTKAGQPLPPVTIDFSANLDAQTIGGLNVVRLGYLGGSVDVDISVEQPGNRLPIKLPINLEKRAVPTVVQDYDLVTGSGQAPSLRFTRGPVNIYIDGIRTKIEAFERDGSPVSGSFNLFEDDCIMDRYLVRTVNVVDTNGAGIGLSSTDVDFGKVIPGTTATETVELSNVGNSSLSITDITSSSSSFIASNSCNTLSTGQTCNIDIRYTASSGAETGTITVATSVGTQTIAVSGFASQSGTINVTEELGFAGLEVGDNRSKPVTINNTGNASLNINGIDLSGDSDFVLVENDCGIISVGESCSAVVNFSPSSEGTKTATLSIQSNDPSNGSIAIDVTGSGKSASSNPGSNDIYIALKGEGQVKINAVSSGTAALKGVFDGTINRDTGAINFNMDLDRAEAKLVGLYILPLSIKMDMLQTRPIIGEFANSEMSFTAYLDVYLKSISLNFFGLKIPIAGGKNCRIIKEREIPFESVGKVNLAGGKTPIYGPLFLGAVEKCGFLNVFVKAFVINLASSPIELDLEFTEPNL